MNDFNVTRYPIDFDALKKGDVISVEALIRITGLKPNEDGYPWAVMQLRSRIEEELEVRGYPVTLAQIKGDLHILEDAEASSYNWSTHNKAIRGLYKSYRRNRSVDISALDEDQKRQHSKRLSNQSVYVQAISQAHKRIIDGGESVPATKYNPPVQAVRKVI